MILPTFVKRATSNSGNCFRNGRVRLSTADVSRPFSVLSGIGSTTLRCPIFENSRSNVTSYGRNNRLVNRDIGGGRCGISIQNIHVRWYTPTTQEEEEKEKARVAHLSPEEKEQELRHLNREIAKLETIRGINTGELYTWSGRYKSLVKNYAAPLFIYYWSLWATMGGIVYLGIDFGGFDALYLLERIDSNLGWSLSEKVDPQLGKMGVALILNECLEPVRLPFVVVTLKPVMEIVSPPKY